jgi:hypothetical protein
MSSILVKENMDGTGKHALTLSAALRVILSKAVR